ncbi:leukocyte immunoglobulin-like receptor subfamily A member 6 [Suncus etruscus]|uniref:leukocyte immunoglobulin-like receptor subfamily A member 6 n=1 Tax=Suncus etruscus TaxID=109475 RepID=UPI00210F68D9|nr:leukocyte immunoglobulin-like receptor subfamily A member 6 [Suncus etruscus]
MQTGTLPRPIIWAEPGSVIPLGRPLTFWCQGTSGAQNYVLISSKSVQIWSENMIPVSGNKAKFTISEIQQGHARGWECQYCEASTCSMYSDKLKLMVTGFHDRPSLSALPSPVVPVGENVTLQCGSPERFRGFVLIREGKPESFWVQESQPHHNGLFQALFPVGPVGSGQNWTFSCYGHFENELVMSEPSNMLQLLLSGFYRRPSLSAMPSPVVPSGKNVTLKCGSSMRFEGFVLIREGKPESYRVQESQTNHNGLFQALFPVGPVGPGQNWTFSCYGHFENELVLSYPSNVLQLLLSGNFSLYKEGVLDLYRVPSHNTQAGLSQADLKLGPISTFLGSTYCCYGRHSLTLLWSEVSDPSDILVADFSISISRSNTGWGFHITDKINSQHICGLHREENSSHS